MKTIKFSPDIKSATVSITNNTDKDGNETERSETEIIDFPTSKKETIDPDTEVKQELYAMIQAIVMTPQGPMPVSQIFKGTTPIPENEMKEKMSKKKTNIIQANGNNQQNDDIRSLIGLIVEDYGYTPVIIHSQFNFIPTQKL